jgi:hypothetical protein
MHIKIPFSSIEIDINRQKALNANAEVSNSKLFVIGFNKTGTTTLKATLRKLGYKIGDQKVAEVLAIEWGETQNTKKIINYCHTAEAFQDLPFSKPLLYKSLFEAFPSSKFILTKRDSSEQWFNSLVKFHTKRFSSNEHHPPDENDLKNAVYRYKGFMLDVFKCFYDYPAIPLYDKEAYTQIYEDHIRSVREYFENKPGKLLEINVAEKGDFKKLVQFLSIDTNLKTFPWKNKTRR